MILYYIDDSMFQNSQFASQVLFRFERYVQKNKCDVIAISTSHEDEPLIDQFRKSMNNVSILVNPSLFDIEGVRGNLHNSFLSIEHFPMMQSFSGSFVKFDTKAMECQRVYLEMFIDHDPEVDWIVQEMEAMLGEKIMKMKKKTILN